MNISLNEYPSIYWKKFFHRATEIETTNVKEWDTILLIHYFAKCYKQNYNIDYSFRFNSNAPTKSYEVYQIRILSNSLSSDPQILKDYIDWFWKIKIPTKKGRITSMAFLTDMKVVNEYKIKILLAGQSNNIDRTTIVPAHYKEIINQYSNSINNYGELSFAKMCINSGSDDTGMKEMFVRLKEAGMDLSMLDRVK
jgi:hypothetical protein